MMDIKTMAEWKEVWGQERYVTALGNMTGWIIYHPNPISRKHLVALDESDPDAYALLTSYLLFGSEG